MFNKNQSNAFFSDISFRIFPYLFLFSSHFIFYSCSTNNLIEQNSQKNNTSKPIWILEPQDYCQSLGLLCATGVGETDEIAQSQAKKNLSQIFSTKIKVQSESFNISKQFGDEEGIISGSVDEYFQQKIEEESQEILQGLEIHERWFEEELINGKNQQKIWVLVTLNRNVGAKFWKEKMDQMDQEIQLILERKNQHLPGSYFKAKNLFNQRIYINERYSILKGTFYPDKWELKDLEVLKVNPENFTLVSFSWKQDKMIKIQNISQDIQNLLNQNEFKILADSQNKINAKMAVLGQLSVDELYLKVEGFKKYNFKLTLSFIDKKNVKINSFLINLDSTARSLSDAYEKIKNEIKIQFNQEIQKLDWSIFN
jgi:hypothetical protein